jgi:hypothetical protein
MREIGIPRLKYFQFHNPNSAFRNVKSWIDKGKEDVA